MAQPAQNTIQWIDWWVQQKIVQLGQQVPSPESPVKIQTYMTLTRPQELNGWKVCRTSGNANDCMIHSLLIELSPTFQRLSENLRNTIARAYRTTKFSTIDKVDRGRAESEAFLEDSDLLVFGNYYNINILAYIPTNSEFQFVSNGKPGECIIIHYNGANHYSAMLASNNNPFIEYDDASRLATEFTKKDTNLYCEYSVDSLIEYEGNQKKVIERRFPPEDVALNDTKFCNALRLVNSNVDAFIGAVRDGGTSWNALLLNRDAGTIEILEDAFLTPEQRQAREQYLAARQRAPPRGSASGPSTSSSFLPLFGKPTPGRAGSFDAFPDDDIKLILETELESIKQQETKSKTDQTLEALQNMQENAAAKLKKLEFVQWFFDSGVPLDCKNLQNKKLNINISKRLKDFAELGLLDKLYRGIFPDEKNTSGDDQIKERLIAFFTTSPEMVELCKLAKLDLVLNNVSKFYEVARQPKYADLFEDGKIIQPPVGPLWNNLLKELQKRFKYTRANVSTLLPYLEGSNALLAYRKAAKLNIDEFVQGPIPPSKLLSNLTNTKWLRELLTTYRMPGLPIQIAIDFEREDISDAFVKDIPEDAAKGELEKDYSFLNGKEFVKNMITNRNIPTTFKLANEIAGDKLTQKLEDGYFETQKIPLLEENAAVFISKEITEEVDNFERLDKNPEEFDQMSLSNVSVPIFIIFSCLKRKKLSRTKIWQKLMSKEDKPKTPYDQAEIDRYINALEDKDLLYVKDADEFIYEPFHTSIIILCNGKIYTMGYGSDPFYDAEQASAPDGDAKIKYLKKMEGVIKNITGLRDVQILGTGFIYSPDSLNIEDEELNYRIVDAGILKKSNIVRLNKILATVKQTRAITMVVDDANGAGTIENKLVTVEQLSCQTMCIYSRLATRYTQGLPFASQLMNCSSFVELGFPERINCTATLGYSDPDACISRKFGKVVPIEAIFDSYFAPNTTIGAFKTKVGYVSDVPQSVSLFNKVLKRVETVSTPWFISNPKVGAGDKGGALKLKNRKKQKRPKNNTARKSSNK